MAHPHKLLYGGLCVCLSTLAQEPPKGLRTYPPVEVVNTPLEYRQFERIEITGSLITAPQAKETLPVQVISRLQIDRSGATNLPQLLQALPGMFNFQELGNMTGTKEGGPETAAIHGNAAGTLVLLNGRRLPAYGSQSIFLDRTMVDINIVPLSAIDRVEVLTDGASSRYGSDAVAGVVNIITKTTPSGLTLSTEYTRPGGGLAQGQRVNLSWGAGRIESQNYRLQAHFSTEKQKALLAGDVTNARNGAIQLTVNGQTYWGNKHISTYGWPASIYDPDTGRTRQPSLDNAGACPANWYTSSASSEIIGCWRNSQNQLTLYPATQKQQLFLDGEVILAPAWRGFAQLTAGQQEQRSVPSDGYDSNSVRGDGTLALINSTPLDVVRQSYRNSQHQWVLGLRGEVDLWDIRASASSGRHQVTRVYTGGVPNDFEAFDRIALTPSDLAQSSPHFSPELLAKFAALKRDSELLLDEGYTQLQTLNLMASKELLSTDDGPIAIGLGWDWRGEKTEYKSPLGIRPEFSGQRRNWSAYSELQAPLHARHDVSLALRHDQYSDFGGVPTVKLGWRWRPVNGFMVRSSIGTGFRAPTVAQMQPISTEIYEFPDVQTNQNLTVRNAGNPQLKPEQSTQATLGFRWEPSARLSLGADYWQLRIRDTFGTYTEQDVLDSETLRKPYIVTENGKTYLDLPNLNLGNSQRQGIDYDIQWREPTDWGRMRIGLHGSWILQARTQGINGGPFESELGMYASNTKNYTPRHQWVLTTTLDQADWSGWAALRYRSGLINPMWLSQYIGGPEHQVTSRVPGYWTVDVGGRWKPQKAWNLSAHVQNVTNRSPALMHIASSYFEGVDTRFANYYGRTLKLMAEYKF